MAGRPPAGGTTGLLVGMCVSIGLALIAIVLLVVLWTSQEELQAAEAKANANAQRLMKQGEKSGAIGSFFDQAGPSKSLAKLMHDEMSALGAIITSAAPAPAPNLANQLRNNQLSSFWSSVENDELIEDTTEVVQRPLLEAAESLYGLYKTEKQANTQNLSTIEQLNTQIAELIKTTDQLRTNFDQTSGELQSRLAVMEDEWAAYRAKKEDEFTAIERASQQRTEQTLRTEQEFNEQIVGLRQELAKREARAKELQGKLRGFQVRPQTLAAARQADGEILMANPGDRSVFINLGADDHLVLGMTFAVYPPDTGIPSSGVAKATIEVQSIGDHVTECRIKRDNKLFPILEGDLVSNPIYDRQRSLVYYVLGEFDLNYDDRDDPNGRATIQAVIKESGGIIGSELNARVDFVVAGARPMLKSLALNPSAEAKAIHDDQMRSINTYSAAINEAQSLSIPIFTQETFLNFMGRAR